MTSLTIATPVTTAPPTAFDQFLAAENAAWDAYEAALAVAQEVQEAFVAAGSSKIKAYRAVQWRRDAACNALGVALAVASAEYEDADARVVTGDDGLDPALPALSHPQGGTPALPASPLYREPAMTSRPARPAKPSYYYATPANQCEYAGPAWDSLTVSQLRRAVMSMPAWWDARAEYYDALAAWELRCAALVAAGTDYHMDDVPTPTPPPAR